MKFASSDSIALLLTALITCNPYYCNGNDDDVIQEILVSLHETCVEETGVDEALIEAAKEPGDLPTDRVLKCYMKCLFEEIGVLEETEFDGDALIEMLPEKMKNDYTPAIEHCKGESGADSCELAYNINVCTKKFSPDKYILF